MASNADADVNTPQNEANIDLLRHIVTESPDVIRQLKHAHKCRSKLKTCLYSYCWFWCYISPGSSDSCDCWYDLEYFSFINGKEIDTEKFNTVCSNLQRGTCPHVLECEQYGGDVFASRHRASTTLLHAAAAVGNVEVAEFLTSRDKRIVHKATMGRGLAPLHLALIKSQDKVLKYLQDRMKHKSDSQSNFILNTLALSIRDMASGQVSSVTCPVQRGVSNLAYILKMYNITDENFVAMAINISNSGRNLANILAYFLLNNEEDRAISIITNKYIDLSTLVQHNDGSRLAALACVLADADRFLRILIETIDPVRYSRTSYGCGYNVLDVALAFGSQKCLSILQPITSATPGVFTDVSPFIFLVIVSQDFEMTMASVEVLLRRCKRQGFDINYVDILFGCSAVILAAERQLRPIVTLLLQEGADINSVYRGKTLICIHLERLYSCPAFGNFDFKTVLMILLQYNPSPSKARKALDLAMAHDLDQIKHNEILSERSHNVESENTRVIISDDRYMTSKYTIMTSEDTAMTLKDTFLSISTFAILYELGFQITESCLQNVRDESTRNETVLALYTYIMREMSCIRSLKSSCRLALRKGFPGNRLHAYLSDLGAPLSVVDYVIRPWFLRSDKAK